MKLRRYGQFINESVEITDDLMSLLLERGRFWNELMNLDYSEFDFTYNFSDMCKRRDSNPEMDFERIQKYFDEQGLTLEKLKELFSEENNQKCGYDLNALYKGGTYLVNRDHLRNILLGVKKKLVFPVGYSEDYDTIMNPFSVGSSLDSQTAAVDVYLYFLFQKLGFTEQVWLGGDGWGNIDLENDDRDYDMEGDFSELFIRYKYGYHQTEYGKLWMKQCGIDEQWFEEKAMKDFQRYLDEEFAHILGRVDPTKNVRNLSLDDYSIVEKDRIIINLSKLVEVIKNSPDKIYHARRHSPSEIGSKEYVIDEENITAQFSKELSGFNLDIELTDTDDLIIWANFKEY